MATPAIKGELLINGTWVDVTALGRVRIADKVQIQRGYLNEQGDTITPSTAAFSLNNADGLFSDRNPNSQYFGLLGQNTQCRFSVTTSPLITDTFTRTVTATGSWGTADTGDVWGGLSLGGAILTTDFAVTGTEATHSVPAVSAYRLSRITAYSDLNHTVRATFKVAQATGGNLEPCNIVLRGTSTTSYFMIRCEVTTANVIQLRMIDRVGGTSAAVDTGIVHTGIGQPITVVAQADGHFIRAKAYIASGAEPAAWPIYAYDATPTPGFAGVRSGVAAANTNAKPVVFTYDNFQVVSDDYRHWGEISEFPQYWDMSGHDVYVPVVASDILRRLTQGAQQLQSPIYGYINGLASKNGYWTFQDDTNATEAGSAVAGAKAATVNDIRFGFDSTLPGSSGVAHVNSTSSVLRGTAKTVPASTYASAMWMFRYDTAPSGSVTVMNVIGTGTVKRWNISVTATSFNLAAYDKDDALLNSTAVLFGTGVLPSQWITMRLQIHVVAGNIAVELGWSSLGQGFAWGITDNSFVSGTSVGIFTSWNTPIASGNVGLNMAHLVLSTVAISNADTGFLAATNAYLRERVDDRINRVCAQSGIAVEVMRSAAVAQTMGYQPVGTLMDVLAECARVDGGFFTAGRGFFGLVYRVRKTLYTQTSLALSYTARHFSGALQPTDDDQALRNDVTVTRPLGGSARSIVASGRKGTAQVGTYDTQYPLNPSTDADLVYLAQQATSIGTWDDLRWPTVQVNLASAVFAASAALSAGVRGLDVGDPIAITGLPAWLPPNTAEIMVRGWREVLGDQEWSFVFNTQPYGPYRSVNDQITTGTGKGRYRAAASNSVVKTGFTTTATTFTVTTATGAKWIDSAAKPASFPIDVFIAGERMTVGAIAAAVGNDQVFSSVTRSVNGIVKAQLANAPVQVAEPFYVAL